jgi:radical SAM protein with 4Fe4S-binding SPASM domain
LLERVAAFGDPKPHVILTGGDPLERADLFDLVRHARSLGLGVSVSPSATPRLTPEVVRSFKTEGVEAISLSIDGSCSERHDGIRGVPGCFERTLDAGQAARGVGLPVQVNTLVSRETVDELPAIYELARWLGAARWSLFFLVSVGRGTVLVPIDPRRAEELLEWLADRPVGPGMPVVTTTEAPHYRRIALQRRRLPVASAGRSGFGVRDGNGVLFVSSTGDVSPSGFLPLSAGNVRESDVVELYRRSPLFEELRSVEGFHGRCGVCEYHGVCGGSRARAWTATGDVLDEDPLCTYLPRLSAPAPHG